MISIQTAILLIFGLLAAEPSRPARPTALLEDGAVLSDAAGTAVFDEVTESWRFSNEQPLTTADTKLPAGYEMRLLPCRGLELIMAYAGGTPRARVRLTGIVTRYEDINFLFVLDAEPIQEAEESPEPPAEPPGRLVTDPNETSILPREIFERLRSRTKTDFRKLREIPDLPQDRMLVSRTGYFSRARGYLVFELNGFGLGAAARDRRLLPNAYRRQIEERMVHAFSRPRYTVTAIETTFGGETYLLLQGIRPSWSHGNFTP